MSKDNNDTINVLLLLIITLLRLDAVTTLLIMCRASTCNKNPPDHGYHQQEEFIPMANTLYLVKTRENLHNKSVSHPPLLHTKYRDQLIFQNNTSWMSSMYVHVLFQTATYLLSIRGVGGVAVGGVHDDEHVRRTCATGIAHLFFSDIHVYYFSTIASPPFLN